VRNAAGNGGAGLRCLCKWNNNGGIRHVGFPWRSRVGALAVAGAGAEGASWSRGSRPQMGATVHFARGQHPRGEHSNDGHGRTKPDDFPYSPQSGHYGSNSLQQYSRSNYSHSNAGMKQFRRRMRQRVVLIASVVVAAFAIIWLVWYFHTAPVTITVNDVKQSVPYTTTYDDLRDMNYLVEESGDLVAVDGSVITEGAGGSPKVFVNGKQVTNTNTRVKRNSTVTEERGDDVTEDYTVTESTVTKTWDISGSHSDGALGLTLTQGHDGLQRLRTGVISGRQAVGDDSDPMVPWTVRWYNVSVPSDQKVIALTFDDGPSEYTTQILDLLNQYGAHATFFEIGQNVEKYPEISKAVVDQGSQVASHTYDHPDNLTTLSESQVKSELQQAQEAIYNATGVTTTTFRGPNGYFGPETWSKAGDLVTTDVYWNLDSGDWSRPGADVIASNVISGAKSGRIVIFHDGSGDYSQTVEALKQILPQLQSDGYTFVTIDELCEIERSYLQENNIINENGELVSSS
jgi:peptidoglycan/xylan/chitin deacetylase (PgdA/CDA1 family)